MNTPNAKKKFWQRGSSLVEFIFVAPIILVSGGATVDVARFAQTQQVTSFISQETASLIYRECLDKTVIPAANTLASGTVGIPVDRNATSAAITSCIQRIRNGQQDMLTSGAPGAFLIPSGYRILGTTLSQDCTSGATLLAITPSFQSSYDLTSPVALPIGETRNPNDYLPTDDDPYLTWQRQLAQTVWQDHPNLKVRKTVASGTRVSLPRPGNDIEIVSASAACQKQRFVVVEVTFAFQPFVKFLPNFITGWGINQDGVMRETTVL